VVISAGASATATADANPPPTAVNTAFAGTGVRGMPATAQKGSQPNTTSFPPQSTQPPPSTRAGLPKRPPASHFNVRWLHPPHATVHSAHVANVWFAWHSMHKFMMWLQQMAQVSTTMSPHTGRPRRTFDFKPLLLGRCLWEWPCRVCNGGVRCGRRVTP